MNESSLPLIKPDWPAPPVIKAFTSTRKGGVSNAPYDSLNLGDHVNDEPESVIKNREILVNELALPEQPQWLNQVHSNRAIEFGNYSLQSLKVDACYTKQSNRVCAVMTADCLPVLLTDKAGLWVAAIHAGWRGLANGVIENTLANYSGEHQQLMAWLGPAIGPDAFEVDDDVRQAFLKKSTALSRFFVEKEQKYLADLYGIARYILNSFNIDVYGGEFCTYSQSDVFFSYRRDGETGRMASLIWIESN